MKNSKQTSARAASAASKVLRDGRTSAASKTAAGSALSQRASKKTKQLPNQLSEGTLALFLLCGLRLCRPKSGIDQAFRKDAAPPKTGKEKRKKFFPKYGRVFT